MCGRAKLETKVSELKPSPLQIEGARSSFLSLCSIAALAHDIGSSSSHCFGCAVFIGTALALHDKIAAIEAFTVAVAAPFRSR
jgi:hypothetical protein